MRIYPEYLGVIARILSNSNISTLSLVLRRAITPNNAGLLRTHNICSHVSQTSLSNILSNSSPCHVSCDDQRRKEKGPSIKLVVQQMPPKQKTEIFVRPRANAQGETSAVSGWSSTHPTTHHHHLHLHPLCQKKVSGNVSTQTYKAGLICHHVLTVVGCQVCL